MPLASQYTCESGIIPAGLKTSNGKLGRKSMIGFANLFVLQEPVFKTGVGFHSVTSMVLYKRASETIELSTFLFTFFYI